MCKISDAQQAVQRRIVTELCGMQRPANGVEDLTAGRNALDALRRTAAHEGVIVDTEQAARNDRATRAAKRQQHITEQQQTLDRLRTEFATLARSKPSTNAERQARGYQLEKLLADLFRANELEYTGSTRQPHEQVDGSFHFRGFTYLVEARWRNQPPDKEDLAGFKLKVDGKLESTRGLFISMAGFDEEVLQYFANVSGKRNVIYMTGQDLAIIFEGNIALEDALLRKIDAAEKHGRYLINLLE